MCHSLICESFTYLIHAVSLTMSVDEGGHNHLMSMPRLTKTHAPHRAVRVAPPMSCRGEALNTSRCAPHRGASSCKENSIRRPAAIAGPGPFMASAVQLAA